MMGYGLEFSVTDDGRVRCYQTDGANVGVSGLLRHYPDQDLTRGHPGSGRAGHLGTGGGLR
jgi:hypothetical protein